MDVCSLRGFVDSKEIPVTVQLGISMFKRPHVHTDLLKA